MYLEYIERDILIFTKPSYQVRPDCTNLYTYTKPLWVLFEISKYRWTAKDGIAPDHAFCPYYKTGLPSLPKNTEQTQK